MSMFVSAQDVEIEGEKGTLFTYEVTGFSRKVAEKRAQAASTARFPMKAGASRVVDSKETGDGALTAYRVEVFVLSEDLSNKLGVERAINGLQELGVL